MEIQNLVDSLSEYLKDNKPKYGWVVCNINKFDESVDFNSSGGIVFRGDVL